jgi:hypothetical protein
VLYNCHKAIVPALICKKKQVKRNTSNTLINIYETLQLRCQAANSFVIREWTDMEKWNPVLSAVKYMYYQLSSDFNLRILSAINKKFVSSWGFHGL